MCERYQVFDQAGVAIANSVLQDAAIITTPSDKLFAIDKNKLRRQRNKYRQEIRAEDRFFNWSMAYMLMADKMQLGFDNEYFDKEIPI